jgi:hypothetical protein
VYRYQISQADKLVRIEAHGETDLKSSQQILVTAMEDMQFEPDYDFLVDMGHDIGSTHSGSPGVCRVHGHIKALRGRIVAVASAGLQFRHGAIMCAFAQFRNVRMTVFRDEISAKAWLNSDRA